MQELKGIVGDRNFIIDSDKLDDASTSWRDGKFGMAEAIIIPQNIEQVSQVVSYCVKHNIKIVTQGGKTSLTAASVPSKNTRKQIILKTDHLNEISQPDLASMTVAAGAGAKLHDANAKLAEYEVKVPLGLGVGSIAHLGGNIATNAGGTEAFRFGRAGDLVTELTVVLPREKDNIITLTTDTPGRNAMADFIGSEGVIGIIVAARFKLEQLPKQKQVAFVTMDNLSGLKKLKTSLNKHAYKQLNALERIDASAFDIALENMEKKGRDVSEVFKEMKSNYNFIIELDSVDSQQGLYSLLEQALTECKSNYLMCDKPQAQEIWSLRTLNISEGIREFCTASGKETIAFDLSLPLQDEGIFPTEELLSQIGEIAEVDYIQFGHAANNGLHFDLVVDPSANKKAIKEVVFEHIRQRGGSLSAEHGIGQTKVEVFAKYYPAEAEALAALKEKYDPKNILNPGKVIAKNFSLQNSRS